MTFKLLWIMNYVLIVIDTFLLYFADIYAQYRMNGNVEHTLIMILSAFFFMVTFAINTMDWQSFLKGNEKVQFKHMVITNQDTMKTIVLKLLGAILVSICVFALFFIGRKSILYSSFGLVSIVIIFNYMGIYTLILSKLKKSEKGYF